MAKETHVREEIASDGKEQWLTIRPVMRGEKRVRDVKTGEEFWLRLEDIGPQHAPVLIAQTQELPAKYDNWTGQMLREAIPAVMTDHVRYVPGWLREGEQRMMTLCPSPVREPGAAPLTVPYDEALLAWRHHAWPDCRMTDKPDA